MNANEKKMKNAKRRIVVFVAVTVAALIILLVLTEVLSGKTPEINNGEQITVDPSKLCDTKEEGFDIFEYDEYLKYDRNIYFYDEQSGVTVSVDDKSCLQYGAAFSIVYDMIHAIMEGDSITYNALVGESVGHYDSFTQQQLYDITISKKGEETTKDGSDAYNKYVFTVEYKIHENNGSFRRDIESDASRPQYVVVDDKTGLLLISEIVYVKYGN